MSELLDFCLKYWKELLSCVCILLSVVIQVFKKRPVYNSLDAIKRDILETLPSLINAVEIDGNGQLKKNAVIAGIKKFVEKKYKIEFPSDLVPFISSALEDILSTPHKKEV